MIRQIKIKSRKTAAPLVGSDKCFARPEVDYDVPAFIRRKLRIPALDELWDRSSATAQGSRDT